MDKEEVYNAGYIREDRFTSNYYNNEQEDPYIYKKKIADFNEKVFINLLSKLENETLKLLERSFENGKPKKEKFPDYDTFIKTIYSDVLNIEVQFI